MWKEDYYENDSMKSLSSHFIKSKQFPWVFYFWIITEAYEENVARAARGYYFFLIEMFDRLMYEPILTDNFNNHPWFCMNCSTNQTRNCQCPGLKLLMSKIKTTEPAQCSYFPKFALIFLTLNSSKRWQGLWAMAGSLLWMACYPPMAFPILWGSVKPLSFKRTSSLELWLYNNHADFFFPTVLPFYLKSIWGSIKRQCLRVMEWNNSCEGTFPLVFHFSGKMIKQPRFGL